MFQSYLCASYLLICLCNFDVALKSYFYECCKYLNNVSPSLQEGIIICGRGTGCGSEAGGGNGGGSGSGGTAGGSSGVGGGTEGFSRIGGGRRHWRWLWEWRCHWGLLRGWLLQMHPTPEPCYPSALPLSPVALPHFPFWGWYTQCWRSLDSLQYTGPGRLWVTLTLYFVDNETYWALSLLSSNLQNSYWTLLFPSSNQKILVWRWYLCILSEPSASPIS